MICDEYKFYLYMQDTSAKLQNTLLTIQTTEQTLRWLKVMIDPITFEQFNYYIGGGTQGSHQDFAQGERLHWVYYPLPSCNAHTDKPVYQIKYMTFFITEIVMYNIMSYSKEYPMCIKLIVKNRVNVICKCPNS